MRLTVSASVFLASAVILALRGAAGAAEPDWPWYRGPDADGVSKETDWNPKALSGGAKVLWRANVGVGWGTVAVKGQLVYIMGNKHRNDHVQCLDIKTGKEKWKHTYPCSTGKWAGPRATPAVLDGVVYSLSREGHVFCLDAATGAVKWQKNITTEFKAQSHTWGHSGSPRIAGRMLVLNAGPHGLALDRKTGAKIWSSGAGTGGYATPVIHEKAGKQYAVIFALKEIVGVELATGRKMWSFPWENRWKVNSVDPIVYDDKAFFTSGYGRGCGLVTGISGRNAKKAWENKTVASHLSPVVMVKGFLYGVHGNAGRSCNIKCVDRDTGVQKWARKSEFCTFTAAGDKLIILDQKGVLSVADASPVGYKEHSRAKAVGKGQCWTAPVLCRGMVFCRSKEGELACVNMK